MIVKNEAPVIRRCLASVRPIIDAWVVVDTGSTDGTQDLVRAALGDLPGRLVERPWVDFAHNRSEALALARDRADFSLIIDADDELSVPPDFRLPELDADAYALEIRDTGITYRRTQLVANARPWRYEGVLHEYLACDDATRTEHLPLRMRRNHDGARRRDPGTYRNDAAVLERALQAETRTFLQARYTFYLAQSYRDCGEPAKAVDAYLRRAEMGHWDQEVYVSLYQAGRLMEGLRSDPDEILALYRRATETCPARVEATHAASRLCRSLRQFERGFRIAATAIGREMPDDGLFVEGWIYAYGLLDEYAVNAYWAEHYRACVEACTALLTEPVLPAEDRKRVAANLDFARTKLAWTADAPQETADPHPHPATWEPDRPLGGTELMVEGLRRRLQDELAAIDLHINAPATRPFSGKPVVVWLHHDIDQAAVQWCQDRNAVGRVTTFVFVSYWQRERFIRVFGLPPERCVVIRNATTFTRPMRECRPGRTLTVAYTSTPFRGLSVLLDAWEMLKPQNARLQIWSSMRLYGPAADDTAYRPLFARAAAMSGVSHEGLLPNDALRDRLRSVDILAYPSTFAETSCLSVIEAMAAGCRVICPSLGALPETTFDFARVYSAPADATAHAAAFARELDAELNSLWDCKTHLSWMQQGLCQAFYDWDKRVEDWRSLIRTVTR